MLQPRDGRWSDSDELLRVDVPLPHVEDVEAINPYTLRVTWNTGYEDDIDIRPLAEDYSAIFGLLLDPELFETVGPDKYGDSVSWNDGTSISATMLYELAHPAGLTNLEFCRIMATLGTSPIAMAVLLGISYRLVLAYQNKRFIPRVVALAARQLAEQHHKRLAGDL